MALTNAGRDFIAQAIVNASSPVFFDNAAAHIGVGDSSSAFSAAHTDLQAASNKLRKGMDSTYPTRSSNVLTFRSTFSTAEANFAWNEWAVFNASSSGAMLTRKVESLGTKTSAQSWQMTATLTVTAA
jgi:hypothetical protein